MWSRCSSLNLLITAAITSLVPGCCISCITDRDARVSEDDKGVIDREDHEGIHDMVEKDVLEEDNDILENEDYEKISNVTEKNIKRKFTRESRKDSEEELVIGVIMSGEEQQGHLMLLTGSANYIYSYTKILNLTRRWQMTAIIQGCQWQMSILGTHFDQQFPRLSRTLYDRHQESDPGPKSKNSPRPWLFSRSIPLKNAYAHFWCTSTMQLLWNSLLSPILSYQPCLSYLIKWTIQHFSLDVMEQLFI